MSVFIQASPIQRLKKPLPCLPAHRAFERNVGESVCNARHSSLSPVLCTMPMPARSAAVLLTRLLESLTCSKLPESSFRQHHLSLHDKIKVSIKWVKKCSLLTVCAVITVDTGHSCILQRRLSDLTWHFLLEHPPNCPCHRLLLRRQGTSSAPPVPRQSTPRCTAANSRVSRNTQH